MVQLIFDVEINDEGQLVASRRVVLPEEYGVKEEVKIKQEASFAMCMGKMFEDYLSTLSGEEIQAKATEAYMTFLGQEQDEKTDASTGS